MRNRGLKDSFNNGWEQIPPFALFRAKEEIKDALGLKTDAAFYNRKNGKRPYTPAEKEAVEKVFRKYKIVKNIWL